ncbi:hypothetical protein MC885_004446 [Smutsia gigantea]|nr:hypothetical protein MC885_004446 [Smutsia gigantea]
MAKLEDARNVGILVARVDSLGQYSHLEPVIKVKDSLDNKTVGAEMTQTSSSDGDSTSITLSNKTHHRSRNLKTEEKRPFVPPSMTKNQSSSFGQMTSRDKEKINTGALCVLGDYTHHYMCESQLPESKESKEAELLYVGWTAKEEQERHDGSECSHPQISDSHDKEDLLHKHHMLQDEIARLRMEVDTIEKSHCSRIAPAVHDHEQNQALGRKLELAFQREREEWFCFRDKINFDMSNLKEKNEILSQQLSKAECKFSSLETELCHTQDALRENTLVLERVRRELSHTQCQKKEMEHRYQDKLNKYIRKQESLQERLSELQSENELFRQQLNEAQNKAENREKTLINIQGQLQEIKKLQTESEKCLMLEKRNKELINDCNNLKERLNHCESEKREKEVGDLTTALEISSSGCLPVVKRNQVEQVLLSMASLQKKCEKLEKTTKKLEQEVGNLKTHMEANLAEHCQVEQFRWFEEERARQKIAEKLKEVSLFLQVQTSSQEKLEQLRANDASLRRKMELRIKELESELSKKTYQEDSVKTKLKKYKQLYLEELEFRKSLANRPNDRHRTNEMLAEMNTRLLVEKQQNRSSLSSLTMRPVLEPPCIGNHKDSVISRHLSPRENLVIPTSSQQISSNRMETYLLKVSYLFSLGF